MLKHLGETLMDLRRVVTYPRIVLLLILTGIQALLPTTVANSVTG